MSFEVRHGSGASYLYQGKIELAFTNDSEAVQDPAARILAEEAFEAIAAAIAAQRATH